MRPQLTNFRSISSMMLWCAALLITLGFATQQAKTGGMNAGQAPWMEVPAIFSPAALVAGSVLIFLGAVRMSLIMRPRNLVFFGILLIIAVFIIPIIAAQFFPSIKTFRWTGISEMPLYACELAGMIFLSTGLLRLLSGK